MRYGISILRSPRGTDCPFRSRGRLGLASTTGAVSGTSPRLVRWAHPEGAGRRGSGGWGGGGINNPRLDFLQVHAISGDNRRDGFSSFFFANPRQYWSTCLEAGEVGRNGWGEGISNSHSGFWNCWRDVRSRGYKGIQRSYPQAGSLPHFLSPKN